MQQGLHGKLPARRDFVSIAVPRRFLTIWEPWLQESLAASRASLGEHWMATFCRAPIWRFWLGPALCGVPAVGAFMPSTDAVGREFPLALVALGDAVAPPVGESHAAWFAAVEPLLLGALDPAATLAATTAALDALAPPLPDGRGDATAFYPLLDEGGPQQLSALFADAPVTRHTTFWWTIGGDDVAAAALRCDGMPSPALFATFLGEGFALHPATDHADDKVTTP